MEEPRVAAVALAFVHQHVADHDDGLAKQHVARLLDLRGGLDLEAAVACAVLAHMSVLSTHAIEQTRWRFDFDFCTGLCLKLP